MNSSTTSRLRTIGLWTAKILLAAFFLQAAVGKLAGAERHILLFDQIGLGQWFRYVTAVAEIVAAVLLLVPSTSALGALGFLGISVGAGVALVAIGRSIAPALVTLVWSGLLLFALREQFANLTKRILGR